jgi:hypothetical protein
MPPTSVFLVWLYHDRLPSEVFVLVIASINNSEMNIKISEIFMLRNNACLSTYSYLEYTFPLC